MTALVSYERAKAESLGLSAKGGLMERGERMFLLGVAFLGAAIFVPVLWLLFALVTFTAVARFVKVWNAASGRDRVIARRIEAWREGRVDSRWRAWREGRHGDGVPRRDLARSRTSGAPVGRWRDPTPGGTEQPFRSDAAQRRRVDRGHADGATGTRCASPAAAPRPRPEPARHSPARAQRDLARDEPLPHVPGPRCHDGPHARAPGARRGAEGSPVSWRCEAGARSP